MEPSVATYAVFLLLVTVLGMQTWTEQNDKLVSSKMCSSVGFQAQQSPLHFLTLLFSPQFGPSLLHEEKQKMTSTWRPAPVP